MHKRVLAERFITITFGSAANRKRNIFSAKHVLPLQFKDRWLSKQFTQCKNRKYVPKLSYRTQDVKQEIQDLEDSYAEDLADGVDARSLSLLWERIKQLNRVMQDRQQLEECK